MAHEVELAVSVPTAEADVRSNLNNPESRNPLQKDMAISSSFVERELRHVV